MSGTVQAGAAPATPAQHRPHTTPTAFVDGPPADGAAVAVPGRTGPAEIDATLAALRRHARQFVAELAGPVNRLRLRCADAELEVEWSRPVGPGSVPAAPATVPADVTHPSLRPAATRTSVRSPIVGTFYRAAEPGAAPFVAVGDLVRPGQVVGIVEAMKLMNEITADRAGRVAELLVADGQPVEYDQPLVALDPA
ncbi:acetyl-CoA carboxylase biotin carboxyl carrier protein [Micromonospora sp. LOL_024]|uniref:acetyl-CoA carboxylase biotin carboxyl carrier protein n=1 Tax=Micromonospora sp. LOL_024 TaxID=3345412 RepID=UPI003A860E2C